MKTKTHKKLNVSIPIELHDFLVEKQKAEQATNPLATIPLSAIVAKAIKELKEDEEGKAASDAGANALKASVSFASMSSTATKKTSRRVG